MLLTRICKTRFFTTSAAVSCAALFLSGGTSVHAQADTSRSAETIDHLYVSAQGSDSWSGQSASPGDAGIGGGPFQTLAHAEETVNALTEAGLARPVEIAVDSAVCPGQDFLGRWFAAAPQTSVIWHTDANRTILIYTPNMSQQIEALASEDAAEAPEAFSSRTTRFYVSPDGNDAWRGTSPAPDADNGPFRTLDRSQEAVRAFLAEKPGLSVEVVFEAGPGLSGTVDASVGAGSKSAASKAAGRPKAPAAVKPHASLKTTGKGTGTAPAIVFGKGYLNGIPVTGGAVVKRAAHSPKLVFAHFVYAPDYGGSVAGYERDMQEAQAAGIDGFALNCGDWNGGQYKTVTAKIFQAAAALNSGFKLFFSADLTSGLSAAEIQDMVKTYGNNPYYFHFNNRPVLSTWGGETMQSGFWNDSVLVPLKQAGFNVYFVPRFYTMVDGQMYETATAPQAVADTSNAWWKNVVDGLFVINGLALNLDTTAPNVSGAEGYASVLHKAGRTVMSSVSPQYWGNRQISIGRRYFEYSGGEGLARQWQSIINVQKSDWVELFTWNDFDEATYFSPIDDVNKYWPYLQHPALGFYKTHAGILKLNQYYVNWFKTGVKPMPSSDSLYAFYRTHPKSAPATKDKLGPVNWIIGNIQDDIYVTTILTAPASLVVNTGSQTVTIPVPAGLHNSRVPFSPGAQTFQIARGGKTIVSQAGEPITSTSDEYNFIYYTVSASN